MGGHSLWLGHGAAYFVQLGFGKYAHDSIDSTVFHHGVFSVFFFADK